MRVISGLYKNRLLKGDNLLGTRPTMARVKESLIALIQDYIKEAIVLDLFAGSGSLGIEVLSNGAKICYFCDKNTKAGNIIKTNLENLNIESSQVLVKDYQNCLNFLENKKFDIIILDPPYHENILDNVIDLILKNKLLKKESIIVCETDIKLNELLQLKIWKQKKYGDKYITIYKIKEETNESNY